MSAAGKIFVFYPRGARTGGPEALHQLVDALRTQGRDAYLVPLPGSEGNERVAQYDHYDAPEQAQIDDVSDNLVVAAESAIDALRMVNHASRVCWWLSIDNSIPYRFERRRADARVGLPADVTGDTDWSWKDHAVTLRPRGGLLHSCRHIAQSEYARSYVFTRLNVVCELVTDYIPRDDEVAVESQRLRRVAYNPKKGRSLAVRVQAVAGGDIEWFPLQNLSARGVVDALAQTSVYLDLGAHPGRDRLPREAARRGAVTMVAQRGAGAYFADVPIADRYKVDPRVAGFEVATARAIRAVLDDRETHVAAQEDYRRWIDADKTRFFEEVRRAFT